MPQDLIELLDGSGFMEMDQSGTPVQGEFEPGISLDDFRFMVRSLAQDAVNYAEEELAEGREDAQQFYDGEDLPGDEGLDETRSKIVSRDVHDTTKAMLPDLLRIFFGGKNVVMYEPTGADDEMWAEQATDYVNQIVLNADNDAFTRFYDVFWDALVKRTGTVMYYWEDDYEVIGQEYTGLTEDEYKFLLSDTRISDAETTAEYQEPLLGMMLYDCRITYRIVQGGKIKIDAVPPEERLINKSARTIDDSKLYGRRQIKTVSEVVAMGYAYDQVVRLGGSEMLDTNEEQIERYDSLVYDTESAVGDPSLRTLEYCDLYVRGDLDGDGFAELYHVACGGTNYQILEWADGGGLAITLADDIPYAEFCPDPIPHIATGHSIADNVMDVQRVKSNLLRGTLDSLSRSIFSEREVVQHQVNMNDVLNPEIGSVIRVKQPGMVREITTPFMGKEALPVLGYMDEVKANRTGITDITQGLDPKALQSTAQPGVDAVVSGAKQQVEMVARIFAKGGMCRMFKGILKLIKTHQDKARTVKLRGDWVPVDPSVWNVGMNATVNTALGKGTESERIGVLNMVAEKQERILEQLGPTNPLCTLAEYRNTLAEMIELAGYPNADRFFLPVSHQQVMGQLQQQMEQMQQQLQEIQQQNQGMQFELMNHSEAEDAQKQADALKKNMEALGKLVDALQTAQEMIIRPDAAADELMAAPPMFLQ
jgi:hypothetical protein